MKKLILVLIFLAGYLLSAKSSEAKINSGSSAILKTSQVEPDRRILILETYLNKQKSPLTGYSSIFIESADKYNLDWRLIPAITGVESSFGKKMPYNSYNAYGWNNGKFKFQSWNHSINHVAKNLREKYYNRGADTVPEIGRIYAPPSKTWASKITRLMNDIESTQPLLLEL